MPLCLVRVWTSCGSGWWTTSPQVYGSSEEIFKAQMIIEAGDGGGPERDSVSWRNLMAHLQLGRSLFPWRRLASGRGDMRLQPGLWCVGLLGGWVWYLRYQGWVNEEMGILFSDHSPSSLIFRVGRPPSACNNLAAGRDGPLGRCSVRFKGEKKVGALGHQEESLIVNS